MLQLSFLATTIDTSLALANSGVVIDQQTYNITKGLDAYLIPWIVAFLEKNNVKAKDITEVITAAGPGSFTNMRATLATAQSIEVATSAKAIAVPNFDLLNHIVRQNHESKGTYTIALESKRAEKFYQHFLITGEAYGDVHNKVLHEEDLMDKVFTDIPDIKNSIYLQPHAKDLISYVQTLSADEKRMLTALPDLYPRTRCEKTKFK